MTSGANTDLNIAARRTGVIYRTTCAHNIGLVILWMNTGFSSSERSAESTRATSSAQAMKSSDPLLQDWEKTLARKRDEPAIFATTGEVLRTFGEVEQRARDLLRSIDVFPEGNVLAVQIGNHEDWPSVLIGCLRRRLVVLPLEQSISEHQRDEALEICKVKAVVSAVPDRSARPRLFVWEQPTPHQIGAGIRQIS